MPRIVDSAGRREIGKRIRQRRRELDLNQGAIAQTLEVSRGLVSQWESGVTDVDASQLGSLARVLRTTVLYLLGESQAEPIATDGPQLTRLQKMLITAFDALDRDKQMQVIMYATDLAEN